MTELTATNQAISVKDFLAGLGSDTHVAYTDGGYANVQNIISSLKYLGINQVRDGVSNGQNGSAPIGSYLTLARAGIQFTFIIEGPDNASLQAQLALINQVQAAVPGSVVGIEGPNEINNWPVNYNGVTGLQGALAMQQDIYQDVHTDATLAGVPVDYFTGYDSGSPDPISTPGLADNDTQHPYPNGGQAPALWVDRTTALTNTAVASAPAVYTETGYSTNQVDQTVQAKYTLDLLMDAAKQNISKTYLYDLLDAYMPGSPQGDDGFGLFDYTNKAKTAASGIHNLTTLLQDAGSTARASPPAALSYGLSNLPSNGNSLLLQKSDGTFLIAVWAEPQIWDDTNHEEIGAPSQNVTITLPQSFKSISVFDPLIGTASVASYAQTNTVTVPVSDHPILIQLSGAQPPTSSSPSSPPTQGGDTIVLSLSEDAFVGNALFTVSVDGHQVGGARAVTATHSSGQSQAFVLTGKFGTGQHDVAIDFLNDAYGGSSLADRNLYVTSITLDGTTTVENAAQLSQGTADYRLTSGAKEHDTLILDLSEDAYLGDAKFTVSVDGKQIGGAQSVTALHKSGQTQDFTVTGDFGPGAHDVAINFLNDAWGGTRTTDRNLYVTSLTLDGETTVINRNQAYQGSAHYIVQHPTAILGTSGDDTLVGNATTNVLIGQGGNDTYKMQSSDQNDTIFNGSGPSPLATGQLDTAAKHDQLWFRKSGTDLLVEVLGTHQQATIKDWYDGGQALAGVMASDGFHIDGSLQTLVNAMTSFSAHTGFNPLTTTHTSLSDNVFAGSLIGAVSKDWHL